MQCPSNVYQCCHLLNAHQSNKLHSIQGVKSTKTEVTKYIFIHPVTFKITINRHFPTKNEYIHFIRSSRQTWWLNQVASTSQAPVCVWVPAGRRKASYVVPVEVPSPSDHCHHISSAHTHISALSVGAMQLKVSTSEHISLFWFTNVNMAWLRSTYKPTVNRCQHTSAVVFDKSVPVFWLFHAHEQTTAIIVLPSMYLVCGTVFMMNWDQLTSLWLRSETNWSRYYLTCNCFSAFVIDWLSKVFLPNTL